MGNPHAVLKVKNLNDIDVPTLGKAIQKMLVLENGVNVGFFELHDESTIDLKVWERGVGLPQGQVLVKAMALLGQMGAVKECCRGSSSGRQFAN